jgi:DNA-binding transcriptional MerR regulator
MRAAEEALLGEIECRLLQPDRLEAAIERAVTAWQAGRAQRREVGARLEARLKTLTAEITNLTNALATGVAVASIAEALTAREREREQVQAQLAVVRAVAEDPLTDRAQVQQELRAILADWRAELRADVQAARPALHELLHGRVRFVPEAVNGREGFRLEGEGCVTQLLPAGVRSVVPVRGYDDAYLVRRQGFFPRVAA